MSTVPPREVYDPDSNDPNQQPVVVVVRCAKCAKTGGANVRRFGQMSYVGPNRTHGVKSAMTGERLTGWVWFPLTDSRQPVKARDPGVGASYRRLTRVDAADATGVELRCPVCKAAPRLGMTRLQELATEAVTRGVMSIFV